MSIRLYINHLIELARVSDYTHKHAAMILKNNRPIVYSINTRFGNTSRHAEDNVIRKLICLMPDLIQKKNRNKSKFILIVIRITNSGKDVAYSHPCPNCTRLIKNAPFIRRVYYSNRGPALPEPPA